MSDKLKVVLAGCGGMSKFWIECAKQNGGVDIVGMVDINEEAARAKKEEHGLDAIVGSDLESMLDATKPDIVFDVTIPEAHFDVVMTAISKGCHVLGEKPLADSMEHAREMVKAAENAGKIYAVMQNRRYMSTIRGLRDFVASGKIGDLTTVNCDFYIGAHFGGFRDRMEHVLLLDMAIHTFDQARFISGADPVAVYCREWNPKGSWYDHDASAVAVFEMTGGLVYTYRGSWCSEGLNTSWEANWRVQGENGCVTWDGGEGFAAQAVTGNGGFFSERQDLTVPVPQTEKDGGHKGLIDDFIRCVRTGETPETTARDNIKSLAMVFGAIESAGTGKRVEIRI